MSKTSLYQKGKRDANEPEILAYLRTRNVRYTQLAPGDGADLIVSIQPMEYWEIKDPAQPPSKRKLTHCEYELLDYFTEMRIPYVVVETVEDAAHRIDQYFARL